MSASSHTHYSCGLAYSDLGFGKEGHTTRTHPIPLPTTTPFPCTTFCTQTLLHTPEGGGFCIGYTHPVLLDSGWTPVTFYYCNSAFYPPHCMPQTCRQFCPLVYLAATMPSPSWEPCLPSQPWFSSPAFCSPACTHTSQYIHSSFFIPITITPSFTTYHPLLPVVKLNLPPRTFSITLYYTCFCGSSQDPAFYNFCACIMVSPT